MSDEQRDPWDVVSKYDPKSTVAKAIAEALSLQLAPQVEEKGLEMTFEDYGQLFKDLLSAAPTKLKIPGIDATFINKHFSYDALVSAYQHASKSGKTDGYHMIALIGMVRNLIARRLDGTIAWKFQYLSDGFASQFKEVATTFEKLEGRMGAVYSGSANRIINSFCSNTGTVKDIEFFGTTYGSVLSAAIEHAVKKHLKKMWNDARSVH